MRVPPEGNLTVALIRQARFEVVPDHHLEPHTTDPSVVNAPQYRERAWCSVVDHVRLSVEAYTSCGVLSEPPVVKQSQVHDDPLRGSVLDSSRPAEQSTKTITPVVGSPALAGLGVSLIVPGTLLDVVA